jgi:GNAT superfamily N-acetyltransferase
LATIRATHATTYALKDGRAILIRPVEPRDAKALGEFYCQRLSDESQRRRFLQCRGGKLAQAELAYLAGAADRDALGLVATVAAEGSRPRIVGHICLEPARNELPEMAIAVADAEQGLGVGRALMMAAIAVSQKAGVDSWLAHTFVYNTQLRGLVAATGCQAELANVEGEVFTYRLSLPDAKTLRQAS